VGLTSQSQVVLRTRLAWLSVCAAAWWWSTSSPTKWTSVHVAPISILPCLIPPVLTFLCIIFLFISPLFLHGLQVASVGVCWIKRGICIVYLSEYSALW